MGKFLNLQAMLTSNELEERSVLSDDGRKVNLFSECSGDK